VIAMPTLAAKLDEDGVVRYWAFGTSPTLIDKSDRWRAVLARLAGRFAAGHLGVRLERDVSKKNPATTIAFFPLSVAISSAGGVRALSEREEIVRMAGSACRESLALARRIGPVEPAAALGAWLAKPAALRGGLALGRRFAPRAIEFVDAHFGDKLEAQHAEFGREILELGREHGVEMPSLARLLASARPRDVSGSGRGSVRAEQAGESDRREHEQDHAGSD
jgi:2-dehydropantoate 2-reductase